MWTQGLLSPPHAASTTPHIREGSGRPAVAGTPCLPAATAAGARWARARPQTPPDGAAPAGLAGGRKNLQEGVRHISGRTDEQHALVPLLLQQQQDAAVDWGSHQRGALKRPRAWLCRALCWRLFLFATRPAKRGNHPAPLPTFKLDGHHSGVVKVWQRSRVVLDPPAAKRAAAGAAGVAAQQQGQQGQKAWRAAAAAGAAGAAGAVARRGVPTVVVASTRARAGRRGGGRQTQRQPQASTAATLTCPYSPSRGSPAP